MLRMRYNSDVSGDWSEPANGAAGAGESASGSTSRRARFLDETILKECDEVLWLMLCVGKLDGTRLLVTSR